MRKVCWWMGCHNRFCKSVRKTCWLLICRDIFGCISCYNKLDIRLTSLRVKCTKYQTWFCSIRKFFQPVQTNYWSLFCHNRLCFVFCCDRIEDRYLFCCNWLTNNGNRYGIKINKNYFGTKKLTFLDTLKRAVGCRRTVVIGFSKLWGWAAGIWSVMTVFSVFLITTN